MPAKTKPPTGRIDRADRLRVEGRDPSKEYRLASRESGRVKDLEEQGYSVVKEGGDESVPGIQTNQADKTLGNRDLILMVKDKQEFDTDRKAKVKENDGLLRRRNEAMVEDFVRKGMMTEKEGKDFLENRDGIVQRRE